MEENKIKEKNEVNEKVYKEGENYNPSMLPGNSQGLPDESFSETVILVDEAFLNKLSKHFGNGKYIKFDKVNFAYNLCKKQRLKCKNIFYYTATPFQSSRPTEDEEKKKEGYNRFINKLKEKGVVIREGRCQRLKTEKGFEYKQKGVDVLLAIDLMKVPLVYRSMARVIIISSDSDFVPAIKEIQNLEIKIILYTYYERKRNTNFSRNNELIKSVYKYVLLTKEDFDNSKLNKENEKCIE